MGSPHHSNRGGRRDRRSYVLIASTLTLAMGMGNLIQFALGALGPILTTDLAITRAQLGMLSSVYFAVGVLLSTSMGGLVDRFGGRTMLVVMFASVTATLLGMAAAPGYIWLLAATAAGAVPLAISNPATNNVVAVSVPRGRQGVLLGIKQSGVQVSAFLTGFILPGAALFAGWRIVLASTALLGLFGVLAARRALPAADRAPRNPRSHRRDRLPALVWWLAAYAALMGAGLAALITYLPLYAHEIVGLSVPAAGATAGVMGFVGIPARILWPLVAERRSMVKRPLLLMSVIATVATFGLLLAPASPLLIWVAAVALGASSSAWLSVAMLAVVRGTVGRRSGRASGVVLGGFYLGMLSSPPLIGWSVDITGSYLAAWWTLFAFTAASAVLMVLWRPAGSPRPRGVTPEPQVPDRARPDAE